MRRDRVAALLLLAIGLLTLGTGVHFAFFRPAMLPEDVRFTGMQPDLLPPQMVAWLQIVFRTWGAFVAGFGVLMLSVGGYLVTSRIGLLRSGTSLALLVAFGCFLVSNVIIRSDYLAFVAALFVIAVVAVLMLSLPPWRLARGDSK